MANYQSSDLMNIVLLSSKAKIPIRATPCSAGLDLFSAYDYVIEPMDKTLIKTDIQICIPDGYYGRIAPRSGLALKHFIDVGAGVIDSDYTGNIKVLLFNFGKEYFCIKQGDRVAQLIVEKIATPTVNIVNNIPKTFRNENSFGSSGTT